MKDLFRFGATELARRIRAREVSSVEVVRAHLERIEAVNSKLNALTVVLADEALTAAEACDRALAEGRSPLGPLHGVPMTVKENIDLAGTATTEGIVALAQSMPASDGPHVLQLRAAGAIPIARSNMPDFGLRWHTDNALRGTTLNPWDRSRTPGGSSGGEAAALATGMTPLGNGNDLGGSLRWPSQCCGGRRRIDFDEFLTIHGELAEIFGDSPGRDLDLKALHGVDPFFRYEVTREGVLLYGDPADYEEFKAYAYRDYIDSADLRELERILLEKSIRSLAERYA